MKNDEETYRKLIKKLKDNEPEFIEKGEVKQRILDNLPVRTKRIHNLSNAIIRISGSHWIQWSISTAAVVLVVVFLSQQAMISKRLKNLEYQLVKTEPYVELKESTYSPSQRFFLKLIGEKNLDSLTVSRKDIDALLEEYLTMKEEIEALKKEE